MALLVLAVPSLALIGGLPSQPIMFAVLNDAAHAPLFAAQSVLLLQFLNVVTAWSTPARYVGAFAIAAASGAAVELVQPYIGRGGQWSDLLTDLLGAAAGLALAARSEKAVRSHARRRFLAGIFIVLAGAMAWPVAEATLAYAMRAYRFPELFSAVTSLDRYFLRPQGAAATPRWLPDTYAREGDPRSLELRFGTVRWPGIALIEPYPDWSGYSRLVLDLTNPGDEELVLVLRIHDGQHNNLSDDRFNDHLELAPRRRSRIEIPLERIAAAPQGRRLDLLDVTGMILYAPQGPAVAGRTGYVTRIHLE